MLSRLHITEDQIRVSSVAGRDNRQFGKENIVDGNPGTYWQSEKDWQRQMFQHRKSASANIEEILNSFDNGPAQWIIVKFHDKVRLDEVRIQFEPGFSAKSVSVRNLDPHEKELEMFFPDDNNSLQVIPIPFGPVVHQVKVAFDSPTDFFGRIAVHALEFHGA